MTRRYTPAQVQSVLRQMQQKQKQAIDRYNQAVRQHNAKVKRAIDDYNREIRAHNSRVRSNRQRLQNAVRKLSSGRSSSTRYVTFTQSVQVVHTQYARLETAVANSQLASREEHLVDLSEREAANSVGVAEALLGMDGSSNSVEVLDQTEIVGELALIAPDLENRWRGAVYALSPNNPDAARHFCSSAREIFVQILDTTAPDEVVLRRNRAAARTTDGRVQRRARIAYLLERQGVRIEELESFAEANLDNVMELFRIFNDGTHGSAGIFTHVQLNAIRKRVESALQFLCQIARTG